MKSKFHCFHLLPVLAAGLMISPLAAQSPERPGGPPPEREGRREAPQPDRLQAAVRQVAELHRAGKHDEAQALSQRLREAAKNNPQAAKQIFETMRDQRQQPAAKAPQGPQTQPNMPEAPQRPMMRPNAPGNPQGPQMQFKAPQRQMLQPSAPGNQQGRMTWPKGPGFQRHSMMQPNQPGRPQAPQMQFKAPQAPQCQQCPMTRPGATGPQPPVMRPKVEAARQRDAGQPGNPAVAKIRHLSVAAEHLAAAGYPEQAAKAREEAGRMKAALQAGPTPPQAARPQVKEKHEPKVTKDQAKPNPDANAKIMAELQKIAKQMGELSARVRKLESPRGDSKRD